MEKSKVDVGLHLVCFIRDEVKFCLGLSLNVFGHLPSPVPYSSLILQENFDRLSRNISFSHEECVKHKTLEGANF